MWDEQEVSGLGWSKLSTQLVQANGTYFDNDMSANIVRLIAQILTTRIVQVTVQLI